MKRYLLYIVLTVVLSTAGCTRGQWLDEIETKRDEQATVVPILLDAYDKGLWVTSVKVVERTDKYLHHSEYHHRYRLTLSNDTVVEIEIGHPLDDKFYEKRGQAYIREILTSGEGGVEFSVWLPNEEWRQKYNHLVREDGETVRFYLHIRDDDVLNKIYYTSTDGEIVTPYATNVFGANIVSNTYENGQGVITFDGEVTKIGVNAFQECTSLKSVSIPGGVTEIVGAFWGCSSLTSITIPNSVTMIGDNSFENCSSLSSVTIPDSITRICGHAFWGCSSLTSITIPDSVTLIGEYAFANCTSLTSFYSKFASKDGRCLIVGGELNSFAPAGLTEYIIPNSITSIGTFAFYSCSLLTSITIPSGVTSIEWAALDNCTSLASVYCKPTVPPSGNYYMFTGNASSRKIYVPAESVHAYKTAEYWRDYAADIVGYDFENGEMVEEEIPETWKIYYTSMDGNVITLYSSAFDANIVSNTYENGQGVITFDRAVTNICDRAFRFNKNLASISMPNSITSIGNNAFSGCSSLASITIPDRVTSIGESAFSGCSSLTSITIPDSVTSIGSSAFSNCSSITEFKGKFASADGRCLIIDGVLNSFAIGCGLTEYTIPDGVTLIGSYAFSGCSSLASITIPDSVTSIGGRAFSGCSTLASITIPEGITSIGEWAFHECSSLTSITIPDSVTSIGEGAFYGCSSLTSVTIPNSVTSIGESAFSGCSSITEFNGKFKSDDGKCLIVDGELRLFAIGCGLTEYTIPEGVTSIEVSAFRDCKSLESVTIPDSVIEIGYMAFIDCSSLAEVYCKPTTPPSGSSYMFDSNASGRKIYVPTESVEAYKTAKRWSDYADAIVGYEF